jgi:hypothetical protein
LRSPCFSVSHSKFSVNLLENQKTIMQLESATIQTGSATYCPEDNKLRLYVGRVPRPEYDALRAEGWTATPKQVCQFVAHWTPERRDTALAYGDGLIEDEDQSPAERAADRAERFAGYQEKRLVEATGPADRYDSGPTAHGYQSQARAERAAARHDRLADMAGDAWGKAEYWQLRTAAVISHALHVSTPSVRMGRIKELELAIARHEKADWESEWTKHFRLRLAYENQMLEACGGRAAVVDMVVGGFYKGQRIHQINKSHATGNVVSVKVFGSFMTYRMGDRVPVEGLYLENVERDDEGAYRAPTAEELAQFEAEQKAKKQAKKETKKLAPPEPKLINPTDADAERLQTLWNERMLLGLNDYQRPSFKPSQVLRLAQSQYSEHSKGTYCNAKTQEICPEGVQYRCYSQYYGEARTKALAKQGPVLCLVRLANRPEFYAPERVIILTDKPQKPLPESVWLSHTPEAPNPTLEGKLTCKHCGYVGAKETFETSGSVLFTDGVVCPACEMHQENPAHIANAHV